MILSITKYHAQNGTKIDSRVDKKPLAITIPAIHALLKQRRMTLRTGAAVDFKSIAYFMADLTPDYVRLNNSREAENDCRVPHHNAGVQRQFRILSPN